MKKVLFIANLDSFIYHFEIPHLKYFKDKGYEVHVATDTEEEIPFCDVKHKIDIKRSPYKVENLKAIKQLKKIIAEHKIDLIHSHTPMGGVIGRLAAVKARKKGTKVIYTAHGFHFYKGAPLKNWLVYYPMEKLLARFTDCLITINKEDYEFAKKKIKAKKIEYIPGVGIDENKFNFKMTEKEKLELRKSIGLKKDDIVLIYPAELSVRKNQTMLINVMEKLVNKNPKIHLLLPGKDSMNGLYQGMSEEKNLKNNIHFLGYRKDIPKLLKISNIAISTSFQEGLPVNIMEAIIIGLPIVLTDCRGNRDLVKNNVNGYIVKVNDVDDMVNKILKVIEKNIVPKLDDKYELDNIIKLSDKIYKKVGI